MIVESSSIETKSASRCTQGVENRLVFNFIWPMIYILSRDVFVPGWTHLVTFILKIHYSTKWCHKKHRTFRLKNWIRPANLLYGFPRKNFHRAMSLSRTMELFRKTLGPIVAKTKQTKVIKTEYSADRFSRTISPFGCNKFPVFPPREQYSPL